MLNIFVGSLKYTPIYKTHCCAFGKACERQGFSVHYIFSKNYEWMLPQEIKKKTVFVGETVGIPSMFIDTIRTLPRYTLRKMFSEKSPDYVYLHNYHLLNHYVTKLCRSCNAKFVFHVHEPFRENKVLAGNLKRYWLHFFEYFQKKLMTETDIALVSSKYASRLFDKYYPSFYGRKILVPLMYEDFGDNAHQKRDFITFVGPPFPSKNPEKFLQIVRYAGNCNLDTQFLMISRLPVAAGYYEEENLKIFSKSRISDNEYGEIMKRSVAVIAPYKRTTQSSVVLVSYMYGTPVISSDRGGLLEFVFHEKTGYVLDAEAPAHKWVEGIQYISQHFRKLSINCRNYFVNNFSDQNWAKYLNHVLN